MNLTVVPKFEDGVNQVRSEKRQTLNIAFGDEAPWIVSNDVFVRQKDHHNCGPIACLKVMEMFGYIEQGRVDRTVAAVGSYREIVMNKFADLVSKYDHILRVETRMTLDSDGNNVNNSTSTKSGETDEISARCFCMDASCDNLFHLACCGHQVHMECLASYIRSFPFCLFCSSFFTEETVHELLMGRHPDSVVVSSSNNVTNEVDTSSGVPNAVVSSEADATAVVLCEVISSGPAESAAVVVDPVVLSGPAPPESAQVVPDAIVSSEPPESSAVPDAVVSSGHDTALVVSNGANDVCNVSISLCNTFDVIHEHNEETDEDIKRREAIEKKRNMQESNAMKAIKQRGECLVADGLGTGAVVTLKVDYRTHSHANGLVAIVYKSNRTGAALVCCDDGVITHDGSKRDYWVPSDKYVINAGPEETVALPLSLQKVRDEVLSGTYDYAGKRRISYGKYHAKVIGASSPCKQSNCSCKNGKCSHRCGCRQKKIVCNSSCSCSGNCNRAEEEED